MDDAQKKVLEAPCQCGSGIPLGACHGVSVLMTPPQGRFVHGDRCSWDSTPGGGFAQGTNVKCPTCAAAIGEPCVFAPTSFAPVTRRLDLASGQNPREGFESVDQWLGAQHVVDLQRFPWPFADESVLEIHCSHYLEHVPMGYVDERNSNGPVLSAHFGKDTLFATLDECYRILVPDGWMTIHVPSHRSDRAFQDPTHRRFITPQTFAYFSEQWRREQRLDHYLVDCNFVGRCDPTIAVELSLRSPDVVQRMIQREWNTTIDWVAKIQKKPRLPPKV